MSRRRGTILAEHICNPVQARHYKPNATNTNTSEPYVWNHNALVSHDAQLKKSVSYTRERFSLAFIACDLVFASD